MEAVLEGLEDDLVNVLPALGDAPAEDDLRPYLAWIAHWALDACDADIDVCSETGERVEECAEHDACEAVQTEAYDYAIGEVEMKADLLRDHDLPGDYERAVAAFVGMAEAGRAIWSEPAVAQASERWRAVHPDDDIFPRFRYDLRWPTTGNAVALSCAIALARGGGVKRERATACPRPPCAQSRRRTRNRAGSSPARSTMSRAFRI